jgi:hypothetical protein
MVVIRVISLSYKEHVGGGVKLSWVAANWQCNMRCLGVYAAGWAVGTFNRGFPSLLESGSG